MIERYGNLVRHILSYGKFKVDDGAYSHFVTARKELYEFSKITGINMSVMPTSTLDNVFITHLILGGVITLGAVGGTMFLVKKYKKGEKYNVR